VREKSKKQRKKQKKIHIRMNSIPYFESMRKEDFPDQALLYVVEA
jgi:hypothetical protein